MGYNLNITKTKAKLPLLSDQQIEKLIHILDAELITRSLRKEQQSKLNEFVRVFNGEKKPTPRKRSVDNDNDVLWKHHGVTESEAYDRYHDSHGY